METLVANNMEKEETFEAKVSLALTSTLSAFEILDDSTIIIKNVFHHSNFILEHF